MRRRNPFHVGGSRVTHRVGGGAVYDEMDDHLFSHHDILLPSYAICVEWLDFDPGTVPLVGAGWAGREHVGAWEY